MMLRRLSFILITLVLIAAAADTIAWYVVVQRLRGGLDAWVAQRRAAGWTVNMGSPHSGGWPLAAALTLPDVALQGGTPDIPNGIAWRAGSVVLRLGWPDPTVLTIAAHGDQRLRISATPEIAYSAAHLQLRIPLRGNVPGLPSDLHAEALRATVPPAGATDSLTVDRLDAHVVADPAAARGQTAGSVSGSAAGVTLPSRFNWALGPRIDSFSLDAALVDPLPNAPNPAAAAAAWRNEGGSVEVRQLATQWGPLGLNGSGSLKLDADLQPTGKGTATVSGYAGTLDALARHGLMTPSAALAAKAILSLLATTPAGGGPSRVDVPLALHDHTLFMREIPLLRVPKLDWPQQ